MLEELSPAQFAEWCEYASIEPFGFPVDDSHFGRLCSVVVAAAGASLPPSDFMIRPPPDPDAGKSELMKQVEKLFKPQS